MIMIMIILYWLTWQIIAGQCCELREALAPFYEQDLNDDDEENDDYDDGDDDDGDDDDGDDDGGDEQS